ncbi:HNH endonuclease [Ramlibacter sp. AN1015]|uniref:HNH endonuclease n=1 Tax=Ramlibacter sp. AN1015 TaxID=3133428 RepID=UPI0030BAC958
MIDLLSRLIGSSCATESGCREWMLTVNRGGYGKTKVKGRTMGAHRAMWIAARGPIPTGMLVCHTCDNPRCINIEHLFLGTPKDNMADKMAKGRYGGGPKTWRRPHFGEGHHKAKLTKEKALQIKLLLASGVPRSAVAEQLGLAQHLIYDVSAGRTWRHVSLEVPA